MTTTRRKEVQQGASTTTLSGSCPGVRVYTVLVGSPPDKRVHWSDVDMVYVHVSVSVVHLYLHINTGPCADTGIVRRRQ